MFVHRWISVLWSVTDLRTVLSEIVVVLYPGDHGGHQPLQLLRPLFARLQNLLVIGLFLAVVVHHRLISYQRQSEDAHPTVPCHDHLVNRTHAWNTWSLGIKLVCTQKWFFILKCYINFTIGYIEYSNSLVTKPLLICIGSYIWFKLRYVYTTTIVLKIETFSLTFLTSFAYRQLCCQIDRHPFGSAKTKSAVLCMPGH